jgi:hypothetical protein
LPLCPGLDIHRAPNRRRWGDIQQLKLGDFLGRKECVFGISVLVSEVGKPQAPPGPLSFRIPRSRDHENNTQLYQRTIGRPRRPYTASSKAQTLILRQHSSALYTTSRHSDISDAEATFFSSLPRHPDIPTSRHQRCPDLVTPNNSTKADPPGRPKNTTLRTHNRPQRPHNAS